MVKPASTVPKEVTDLITSSGNTFHAKVASWFKDEGWHVIVSPYYMDQAQGKAREIDLIVENFVPVPHFPSNGRREYVGVRLFIECKYIANETVFWFAEKDRKAARELVGRGGVFTLKNGFSGSHHYLDGTDVPPFSVALGIRVRG